MIKEIIRRNRAEERKRTAKEISERAEKRQREAVERVRSAADERVRGIREYQEKEKYDNTMGPPKAADVATKGGSSAERAAATWTHA